MNHEIETTAFKTIYADERISVGAPDERGNIYVNVVDLDGAEISTYLSKEQAMNLGNHLIRSHKTRI